MTDNRDISHIAYDDRLIDMSGIDREMLPDLRRGILSPLLSREENVTLLLGAAREILEH